MIPDALTSAIDRFDEPRHGRVEPGAENGVDDQRAVAHLGEVQLPRLAVGDLDDGQAEATEDLEVGAGVAAHVGDAADQKHRHADAALHQRAGDDEAVAAVVAAAAEHRHLALEKLAVHRLDARPPPDVRRSPSARARECRSPRSSADRPHASAPSSGRASDRIRHKGHEAHKGY